MFGEEALDAIKTGVVFVFLATVIFFVVINLLLGKQLVSDYSTRLDNSEVSETTVAFSEFTSGYKQISLAGAYAFLTYNEKNIDSITCALDPDKVNVSQSVFDSCVKDHLTGDCLMYAVFDRQLSLYNVYIRAVPAEGEAVDWTLTDDGFIIDTP